MPQEPSAFVGGHWSADIESLRLRAALRREELELLPGFDALGYDPHVKTLSHADNRVDDAGIGGVDPDAANEGLIDLYGVDREGLEESQTRIPGTEIIERQLYAHLLQGPQHGRSGFDVL